MAATASRRGFLHRGGRVGRQPREQRERVLVAALAHDADGGDLVGSLRRR